MATLPKAFLRELVQKGWMFPQPITVVVRWLYSPGRGTRAHFQSWGPLHRTVPIFDERLYYSSTHVVAATLLSGYLPVEPLQEYRPPLHEYLPPLQEYLPPLHE